MNGLYDPPDKTKIQKVQPAKTAEAIATIKANKILKREERITLKYVQFRGYAIQQNAVIAKKRPQTRF